MIIRNSKNIRGFAKEFCSNQFIQLISYNEYKDLNVLVHLLIFIDILFLIITDLSTELQMIIIHSFILCSMSLIF